MPDLYKRFFDAVAQENNKVVYTDNFPAALKAGEPDEDEWIEWKVIPGHPGIFRYRSGKSRENRAVILERLVRHGESQC